MINISDKEILNALYKADSIRAKGDRLKIQLELLYSDEEWINGQIECVRYYMNEKGMMLDKAVNYFESFCEYNIRIEGKEFIYLNYCRNCQRRLRDCTLI